MMDPMDELTKIWLTVVKVFGIGFTIVIIVAVLGSKCQPSDKPVSPQRVLQSAWSSGNEPGSKQERYASYKKLIKESEEHVKKQKASIKFLWWYVPQEGGQ